MAALVLTLTVVVPLLALWAAYITTALAAECDIRDDYGPGRLVWVYINVPPTARALETPLCPPMHYLPVLAEASVVPLLYGRPPVHVTGEVRRVAA